MNKRIVIRLGLSCNNNCKFCIFGDEKNSADHTRRTTAEIKKILLANRRFKSVVFTGGEPCLRPDFIDIIAFARKTGFERIQVQSNGRILGYRDFCADLIAAGANEFAIAVHGHTPKIHDHLTSTAGSFLQTTKGIENLKKLGQYVITNTVMTSTNYRHAHRIAAMLVRLDVEHFQFSFIHIVGRAWENRDWLVPKKSSVIPFLKAAIEIGKKGGKRVTTEAIPYCLMPRYEAHIVEDVIPKSRVFELDETIKDLKTHRIEEKKARNKHCAKCSWYSLCEGPWKEYPGLYGWKEFRPVTKKAP